MDFTSFGVDYKRGDLITVPDKKARVWENIGYVKADSENRAKLEKLDEKLADVPEINRTAPPREKKK